MANPRSRPFNLMFHPNGLNQEGPYKAKAIPANAGPIEIENDHFQGHVLLIHDTGNEPGCDGKDKPAEARRGVEMQVQGKFKRAVEKGPESTHGLWVGGDMPTQLKLGWIMQNVVQLCMKYARKKTEGRLSFTLGSKDVNPHLSFPIGQLFTCISTPPGQTPPVMGSEALRQIKWQGAGWIDIDDQCTYTLVYKTPFMDLCSWELLKVPGVSPLALENILGDIVTAHVYVYDCGITGPLPGASAENWRKGALLEWHFSRGDEGDTWNQEDAVEAPTPPLSSGARTPLDNESDPSEASDHQDVEEVLEIDENKDDDGESEASSVESLEDEDDEEVSRADSQALLEIEGWRPRELFDVESTRLRVPYYIEAIDRRRRRKVRVWYVMLLQDQNSGSEWWHAQAATELAAQCRPRRRLPQFRRGPGARRYTACAVKTLERFRHVLRQQLTSKTRLRDAVLKSAVQAGGGAPAAQDVGVGEASPTSLGNLAPEAVRPDTPTSPTAPRVYTAAGIARKVRRHRGPLLPPRFFVAGGSACGLAFAQAREGRSHVARETLIGAIHFEGRLCEELLRMSEDGILRCFTPYDCDKPRVRLRPMDVLHVQGIDGLFLGRFHMWQVQTVLKVFVFCSHTAQDRAEWIQAVQQAVLAAKEDKTSLGTVAEDPTSPAPAGAMSPLAAGALTPAAAAPATPGAASPASQLSASQAAHGSKDSDPPSGGESKLSKLRNQVGKVSSQVGKVNSTLHSALHVVSLRYHLRDPGVTDLSAFFNDATRARRWRNSRRLVLNDRLLLPELPTSPAPALASDLLEQALSLNETPNNLEIIAFSNAVCQLKAVRFRHWTAHEQLAFWLNIYHCLLLHGYLVLGRPVTVKELKRFHTRVSYLIGLTPISLREIEQAILRIPEVDPQAVARSQANARARQLFAVCGVCRARPVEPGQPVKGPPREVPSPHESNGSTTPPNRKGPPTAKGGSAKGAPPKGAPPKGTVARNFKSPMCMPMPQIPKPTWSIRQFQGTEACLFLGREPETFPENPLDLRCLLVLNRGKKACLSDIPVFHENRLNAELNDICGYFVKSMVQIEEKDHSGRPTRVRLPDVCKPLVTEMSAVSEVLSFIWDFMPNGSQKPLPSCKLKFGKGSEEPYERKDFAKYRYSDPNLQSEAFPRVGQEFDAIATTAQALAKLAMPQQERRSTASPGAGDDATITVRGQEGGQTVEDNHFVRGTILRL